MLSFSKLIQELKEESDSYQKRYLLTSFLSRCPPKELDLAFSFLSGKKEKAILEEDPLAIFASEYLNQPLWLIRSAIEEVGDVSETISLLTGNSYPIFEIEISVILEKANQLINSKEQTREILFSVWNTFPVPEKIFFHKLLLGKQNLKIQETLLIEIVADLFDLETGILFEKFRDLKVNWKSISVVELLSSLFPDRELKRLDYDSISKRIDPSLPKKSPGRAAFFEEKISAGTHFLICPDGIPAQAILHSSGIFIWTKNGFLFKNEAPSLFQEFSRIKKNAKILGWVFKNEIGETIFLYYDILEYENGIVSSDSIKERKRILDSIFAPQLKSIFGVKWNLVSEKIDSGEFQKDYLRENQIVYLFHPDEKEFLEFKAAEQTIKAVLLYGRKAMSSEGSTFWELSFGVPSTAGENGFHTIARCSMHSSHSLFLEIDSFFKENTIEKKGPIRGVPTIWKAELSFRNILPSKRHKIGFVLEDVKILGKISTEESIDSLDQILKPFLEKK
ncbi:hypothetical protein [Leptospira adleri]|uniref:hypothetical protein n=1 Tax=Leptospira adleri TaxID=2023186 RepID=UPI0014382CD7|nr:hypothetical protein [Leptospira adleri]